MTIRQALNSATRILKRKSTSPSLDAEVLLAYVLKKPKTDIFVRMDNFVYKRDRQKFLALIKKRSQGWPVAYLTHEKEFFGLKFYVDKNVLIPRPETEGLVDLVLEKLKIVNYKLKILDIGTGSGCIIVSLAKSLRNAELVSASQPRDPEINSGFRYFASDISSAALKIARKNARRHKVKVNFKKSNLLSAWKNQRFDVIVANLPYLAKETDPSTKFEPKKALIAKNHGLGLIAKLLQQISTLSAPPSALFLEIGHDQGAKIKKLAAKWLPSFDTKIFRDMSGKNRYAILNAPDLIL